MCRINGSYQCTTKTLNTFELPRNSIDVRPDGHFTCQDLTLCFIISQIKVWVSQMHCLDELIMVQVKETMTTSFSYSLSYCTSMHYQAQD
jgi:hypothetical protein